MSAWMVLFMKQVVPLFLRPEPWRDTCGNVSASSPLDVCGSAVITLRGASGSADADGGDFDAPSAATVGDCSTKAMRGSGGRDATEVAPGMLIGF